MLTDRFRKTNFTSYGPDTNVDYSFHCLIFIHITRAKTNSLHDDIPLSGATRDSLAIAQRYKTRRNNLLSSNTFVLLRAKT